MIIAQCFKWMKYKRSTVEMIEMKNTISDTGNDLAPGADAHDDGSHGTDDDENNDADHFRLLRTLCHVDEHTRLAHTTDTVNAPPTGC